MLRFKDLPKANSERWMSLESLEDEIWKSVRGFEGVYDVSNYGRVKSLRRVYDRVANVPSAGYRVRKEKILKCIIGAGGYYFARIKKPNGKAYTFPIHRMVALAFIENPLNKPQIDHCDTNKENNTVTNLRWCTAKENKNNPITLERHLSMISETKRKSVVLLDGFGNYICRFESGTAAAEALRGNTNNYVYGFQLIDESEYDKNKDYGKIRHNSKFLTLNECSVIVYKNGEIIDAFTSHKEAALHFGIDASMISRRCAFYHDPVNAKKKYKTPIHGTDKILNLKDLSNKNKEKAILFLKKKYKDLSNMASHKQKTFLEKK